MKKHLFVMAFAAALCGCQPSNPLLSKFDTPYGIAPFGEITIDHYREAMLRGMEEQKAEIEAIVANPEAPTFANTIAAFDQSGALMRKVGGVFGPLSSSNSTDEMRALQKEMAPLQSAHSDDINFNEALFARVKVVYEQREQLTLTKEEQSKIS